MWPAPSPLSTLDELQAWYASQCDGDWEHGYGVRIETLDNPGWGVRIELADTELEGVPFDPVVDTDREDDWLHLQVRDGQFYGSGDPSKLGVILRAFLDWARPHAAT